VPLRDERIVDATADREGLVFAIAGGRVSASGEAKSWVRIAAVPLRAGGPLWEYTADGVLGGNVVIEGGRVSFPAFEGDLPAERVVDDGGGAPVHLIAPGSLPLRRVSLDRAGGARLSAEELPLHPWNRSSGLRPLAASVRRAPELTELWRFREAFRPPGPRRILPGSAESIVAPVEAANFPLVEYWLPAPGRHPLGVEPGPPGSMGKVLVRFSDRSGGWVESGAMLAAGDTVYESLGGGVLLVKDLAGGAGLDRLLGPHVENDRLDAGARYP
jgi:hypothetical protein